jgi:phospholipid/cholesterol/gamma-HCH transport system permease protein
MSTGSNVAKHQTDDDDDFNDESAIDLMSPVKNVVREIGEPLELLRRSAISIAKRPTGFWGDTRDYAAFILRRALVPTIVANVAYSLLAVVFASAILLFLGAANRLGVPYFIFTIREIVPLFVGTVMAGVIGASITAEIGARKIRGELDALRVMGQDPIRELVIPRMIATAAMTAMFSVFVVYFNLAMGALTGGWLAGTSTGAYLSASTTNITVAEVCGVVGKLALIGLFIGLVCSSKGLNTPPGSEGLGWAVNRSVVVCVLAVFMIDVIFNMILQGLVPSLSVSR